MSCGRTIPRSCCVRAHQCRDVFPAGCADVGRPHGPPGRLAAREEMRADEGDIIYGVEQKLPFFTSRSSPAAWRGRNWRPKPRMPNTSFKSSGASWPNRLPGRAGQRSRRLGQQDLAWLEAMSRPWKPSIAPARPRWSRRSKLQNERAKRARPSCRPTATRWRTSSSA